MMGSSAPVIKETGDNFRIQKKSLVKDIYNSSQSSLLTEKIKEDEQQLLL